MKKLTLFFTLFCTYFIYAQEKKEVKYYKKYNEEVSSNDNWTYKTIETTDETSDRKVITKEVISKENLLTEKITNTTHKKDNYIHCVSELYYQEGYKTVTEYTLVPKSEMVVTESCQNLDGKIVLANTPCLIEADPSSFESTELREWINANFYEIAIGGGDIYLIVKFNISPDRKIKVVSIESKNDEEVDSYMEKEITQMIESIPQKYLQKKLSTFLGEEIETTVYIPLVFKNL